MKKNILRILLLILLAISFINSANAFGIKQDDGEIYECYILIEAPGNDPDCIDPETGLREESECLIETNNRFIYGNNELKAFLNSLTDDSRFGCRSIR